MAAPTGPGRALRAVEAVLLDLDGTLLDTAPDLIGSMQDLLRQDGMAEPLSGHLAPVVSHGSAAMLARALNIPERGHRMDRIRPRFLQHYRNRISQSTRPFAGMPETLAGIEAAGLRWGVVTNKPEWLTLPLLEAQGLLSRAACVIGGDTVAAGKKPHPAPVLCACQRLGLAPGQTVLVGDAQRDITAGRDAGTWTLAAMFGYLSAEDHPARWGADACLARPRDLLDWLRRVNLRQPGLAGGSAPAAERHLALDHG